MQTKKIKLSKKQKEVIRDLQNGFFIITSNDVKGAWIAHKNMGEYYIDAGVFWRLVNKRLIYQRLSPPHYYELTALGKTIKL